MLSTIRAKIISKAKVAIPAEFYDIREETTPKAGWFPMFVFTALIYATAIASFTALYLIEAAKSTTETVIVPYDNTGNDGYTCQMLSRVSAMYEIPSGDPALAYNLVNVIESKSQCTENLDSVNPCNESLTYFPGNTIALPTEGTEYGAAALYAANMLYIFEMTVDTPYITNYDYTTGVMGDVLYLVDFFAITSSLAVDRDGWPIYITKSDLSSEKIVYRAITELSDVDIIGYHTGWAFDATILNDNLYNVYLIENNTFLALDVYTVPAVSAVLFSTPVGENILYAAVYHDGFSPTVYYTTTSKFNQFAIIMYKDGTNTTLNSYAFSNPSKGISVSGNNQLYVVQLDDSFAQTYSLMEYIFSGEYLDQVATIETVSPPGGFCISPSGERIFLTEENSYGVQALTFVYPLDRVGGYVFPAEVVALKSGFGAGWFTCGDKLLNSSQYNPGAVAEYPQACGTNGLVGKVSYNYQYYVFTETDATTYALNRSSGACPALYAPICATVSNLPPYSCSRTLRQGFFSCAATAMANSQFLVQLLIFFCALLLPYCAGRFPTTADPSHNTVVHAGKSIELVQGTTTVNAVHDQ